MLWHFLGKKDDAPCWIYSHCPWSNVGSVNSTPSSGTKSFILMHQLGKKSKISFGLPPTVVPRLQKLMLPRKEMHVSLSSAWVAVFAFHSCMVRTGPLCPWGLLLPSRTCGLSSSRVCGSFSGQWLHPLSHAPHTTIPGRAWQNCTGRPALVETGTLRACFPFAWTHRGQQLLDLSYSTLEAQNANWSPFPDDIELSIHLPCEVISMSSGILAPSLQLLYDSQTQKAE